MAYHIWSCAGRSSRTRTAVLTVVACVGLILFPVAVTAQQAVSEITVVVGQTTPCPTGFQKIDVDLNRGASGNYIWLCVEKGLGAPVTGLWVTAPGHEPVPAGKGYSQIPVDLNRGAGGATIYLYYTKDPNCSVVSAITVAVGQYTPCPTGFQKIDVDLNQDAGGNYIWLCQELQ